jgi:SAM-dependent methyltransferase
LKLPSKRCRCCGGSNFERCGTRSISPFFRRFGLQVELAIEIRGLRLLRLVLGSKRVTHLIGKHVRTEIAYGACHECRFIGPWPELSDDMLLDFYAAYGSEAYKTERSVQERWYRSIAEVHGSPRELELRQSAHEAFIVPLLRGRCSQLGVERISMLDYGGGTGQVAPRQAWIDVDIYDVGDRRVHPLTRGGDAGPRSDAASEYRTYDFVQLLHVLEHVGGPSSTLKRAMRFLKPNGLIYLEVPWEMTDLEDLSKHRRFSCDEHINKFCDSSVASMAKNVGLAQVECYEGFVEVLHADKPVRVVRCTARMPAAASIDSPT